MPIYRVQAPDGRIFRVEGPEGAKQEDLISSVQQQINREAALETRRQQTGIFGLAGESVSRSLGRMGSAVTDVIPALAGSALGFDEYARRQLKEAQDKEAARQAEAPTLYPSMDAIKDPSSFAGFVGETMFEQVPNLATAVASALGGGAAAKKLATTAISRGLAGRAATRGLTGEAAEQYAKRGAGLAAPQIGQAVARGQMAGAGLGSFALTTPEIFQGIYEETGELAPGASLLAGAASATLESILPYQISKKISGPMKAGIVSTVLERSGMSKGLLRSAVAGLVGGVGTELLTEGAQEAISIAAERFVDDNPGVFGSKEWKRIMEAMLRGGVAGGGFGAIGGSVEGLRVRAEQKRQEVVELERQGRLEEAQLARQELTQAEAEIAELQQKWQEAGVQGEFPYTTLVGPQQEAEKAARAQTEAGVAELLKPAEDFLATRAQQPAQPGAEPTLADLIQQAQREAEPTPAQAREIAKAEAARQQAELVAQTDPARIEQIPALDSPAFPVFAAQLGLRRPNANALKTIAGADLRDPAQAATVRTVLRAFADQTTNADARGRIDKFLNTNPGLRESTDVGESIAGAGGEGVGVVGGPELGGPAGVVGETQPSGVEGAGAAAGEPAGGTEQQPGALTEPVVEGQAPVEAAPVEAAPVEAAPVEAAPVEAAPVVEGQAPTTKQGRAKGRAAATKLADATAQWDSMMGEMGVGLSFDQLPPKARRRALDAHKDRLLTDPETADSIINLARTEDPKIAERVIKRTPIPLRLGDTKAGTPGSNIRFEEIEALARGDVVAALKLIERDNANPVNRLIAKRLIALQRWLPSVEIGYHPTEPRNYVGIYDASTHKAYITLEGLAAVETLLHEMMHGVTARILRAYKTSPSLLTSQQIKAARAVEQLYNRTRNETTLKDQFADAMSSVDEFVAYGLTSPEFQNALKETRLPGMSRVSSVLSWFTTRIKALLGLDNVAGRLAMEVDTLLLATDTPPTAADLGLSSQTLRMNRTEPAKRGEPAAAPVRSFTTSKGSTYEVTESGQTVRTKRSEGRGQGETYPPHTAFYVRPGDHTNILSDMQGGMGNNSVRLGYAKDNTFTPVSNVREIPEGVQPVVGVFDKRSNKVVGVYAAQTTPAVGLHPVEKLYNSDGTSSTHVGNQIVSVAAAAPTSKSQAAFARWFGNSKIVDAEGNPLPVYHGMPVELEGGAFRSSTYGSLGEGIYFTSDPSAASNFAMGVRGSTTEAKQQGNVVPAYLKMEEPFDDAFFANNKDWQQWVASVLRRGQDASFESWPIYANWYAGTGLDESAKIVKALHDKLMAGNATLRDVLFLGNSQSEAPWGKKLIEAVKKHGAFDGIILRDSPKGFDELVVFKPTQIKSVFNQGTFDPNNPDILRGPGKRAGYPTLQRGTALERDLYGGRYDATSGADPALRDKARQEYNDLRAEFGLPQVTDWSSKPKFKVSTLERRAKQTGTLHLFAPKFRGADFTPEQIELAKKGDLDGLLRSITGGVDDPAIKQVLQKIIDLKLKTKLAVAEPEGPLALPYGFYSALSSELDRVPFERGSVQQWKQTITAALNKGKIKRDEVEWSGINDWLDLQQGKVSKEQVADYLKSGGVDVDEVLLGTPLNQKLEGRQLLFKRYRETTDAAIDAGVAVNPEYIASLPAEQRKPEEEALLDAWLAVGENTEEDFTYDLGEPTEFGGYVLPGGTNYREILLTLPQEVERLEERWVVQFKSGGRGTPSWVVSEGYPSKEAAIAGVRAGAELIEASPEKLMNLVDITRNDRVSIKPPKYKSAHWDQPNVLAHIRTTDRTDAEGKRVLFVEEIQSDWGQEGKKKGFAGKPMDYSLSKTGNTWQIQWADGRQDVIPGGTEEQARIEADRAATTIAKGGSRPPSAPFVTKTEGWLNLSLKRIVTLAVQEGYDRVAFINGMQSHQRFPEKANGESTEESFKAFYDQIVPAALKKLLPKVGGGSLETTTLYGTKKVRMVQDDDGTYAIEERSVNDYDDEYYESIVYGLTKVEAAERLAQYEGTQQLSFNVTRTMRDIIPAGVPLFLRKAGSFDPKIDTVVLNPEGGMNTHTFIHEMVHAAISHVIANRSHPLTKRFEKFFLSVQGRLGAAYGAQNLQEFSAELISNPEFQALLKDIKTPRSESLFRSMLRSIAEFFGFRKSSNAYTQGLDFINDIIDISGGVESTPAEKLFLGMGSPEAIVQAGKAMPALKGGTVESTKNYLSNLSPNLLKAALGLLRLDNLYTIYKTELPSIKDLMDAIEKRAGLQERNIASIRDNYDKFRKVAQQFPTQMDKLGRLAIDARLGSVNMLDPKSQDPLSREFRTLPPQVREVYKEVRAGYDAALKAHNDVLIEAAKDSPSLAAQLRDEYLKRDAVVAYVPFLRSGDFWASYVDPKTGEPAVLAFESLRERAQFVSYLNSKKIAVRQYQNLEDIRYSSEGIPPTSFIYKVMQELVRKNASQAHKDAVWQSYLATFPSGSIMKQFMKSKNLAGMETDLVRGYGDVMVRWSRKLANAKYGPEIDKAIYQVTQEAEKQSDPAVYAAAQNILGQAQFLHNPTFSSLTSAATTVSYFWFMAGNISTALINMLSMPMLVWPKLVGDFGWDAGTRVSLAAGKIAINNKWTTSSRYKGLYEGLMDHAQLEHTQTRELLEGRRQKTTDYTGRTARILDGISKPLAMTERYNRATTAIAAFDLMKGKGATDEKAIEYAIQTVKDIHTSGMAATGPRWMQNPVGRIFFTFKSFVWNSAFVTARAFHQAMKGADKADREAARRQLLGMYGMAFAFTGVRGMPFYGAVSTMAEMISALFGDEDEPFDFDDFVRGSMNDFLFKGPTNYLTNMELATRAGIANDLLFKDDPRFIAEHGYMLFALSQILGPIGSLGINLERGIQQFNDGEIWRAIETLTPVAIRNGFKGVRFMREGATTLDGDPIMEDISAWNSTMQLIGFAPADLSNTYERLQAGKGAEREILDRRRNLTRLYDMADQAGDFDLMDKARERIDRFNEKYPEKAITADTLLRSQRSRAAAEREMINGVRFDKDLRARIQAEYLDDED